MSDSTHASAPSAKNRAPTLVDRLAVAETCRQEGRLVEAEAVLTRVLAETPDQGEAEHLLGLIAHQRGKLPEAIAFLHSAVKHLPQNALCYSNLAEMLRQAGQFKQAESTARRATELNPASATAWSNLGAALYELKEFEDCAEAHRRALLADPDFALGHCSLGNALHGLKRNVEAIASYRRAVALAPGLVDAWANLGTALHHNGDYDEAMIALRHAIALDPACANARSGLGMLLLMRGDFAEGWAEYEWRLRSTERKGLPFPERPWRGENLAGKHIYVQAEQGLGDTLQFVRYLPLLARRAGRTTLRVHQQLAGLVRESLPGVEVLGDRGELQPFDCDIALMSLPYLLGTRYETIPAEIPYLRAPAGAQARWRRRFEALAGLKVGLIWSGNPEHVNDIRRSLDIRHLATLLEIAGASFASLQFGPRAADLKLLGRDSAKILDLSSELGDFADTAGAMAALDLIVTIDSSGAHLAGALGRPVWVVISDVSDWRWRLDREDNAWYPNARLFRQKTGEAWDAVIARLADALRDAVADPATMTPFLAGGLRRAATAAAIVEADAARARQAPAAAPARNAGQLMAMAEHKRRQRLQADALDLYARAAALEPGNAEPVHMQGIISFEAGKLQQAIEHMRRAVALAPGRALYRANLGEMCRLAGLPREAVAEGEKAVELDPHNAGALSNLGIALFDLGRYGEALAWLDKALAVQGDFAMGHSNRGNALQRLKRFGEAEAAYRRSLAIDPEYAEAWNNLGTCLRELKRFAEAEAAYLRALAKKPHDPEIHDSLALALKDLERFEEAADSFRAALAIEPRSAKILVHFASMLVDRRRIGECQPLAERALALEPDNADAVNLAGRVAFECERQDEAIVHFRRALSLKPDFADAWNNMGNALKDLGRLDEALAAYRRAIELDPDIAGVYVNLADSMKFAQGDAFVARMEAMAARTEGLSKTDRVQLDFALAKAYADLEDYPRSFRRLLAGNAAKRASIAYDEKAALDFFDRIAANFTRETVARLSGGGDPSARPIFVLGMPRSGTTLVEQIIASHPMVHGAGELPALHDVLRDASAGAAAYPQFMRSIGAPGLRQLGADYLRRIAQVAPGSARVTDKMPSNYYFIGLIHLALPNAKILHTVRSPVDNCISCFSKLFTAEQSHTYDLGELGRYYRRYERLMEHWRRVLPPGAFLDAVYEDVVADLEGAARRILAHCGLPWDPRCLSFHETDRPVRTASATQVRQPIYKSAVGRWRVFEDFLGPLLQELR